MPTNKLELSLASVQHLDLGKDVVAELTANVVLPETVSIGTPVYANVGEEENFHIRCTIDPRPLEQLICFAPIPGELEHAANLAQASIRERLEQLLGKETPIFAGTP